MAELCKKDSPQWILVSWWWSPQDAVGKIPARIHHQQL